MLQFNIGFFFIKELYQRKFKKDVLQQFLEMKIKKEQPLLSLQPKGLN